MATTTAVLTVLAFILAAIGLYGIFSYSTQMRQFEIGTRLAIGAKGKDIVWLVLKENMSALATGLCISVLLLIGLYFSFAQYLTSYISTALLTPLLITFLLISLLSFLSCYLPLRQYINKPAIHSLKSND
jgi:ABC-type antimicrobial peptide transport system permease subunit